MNDEVIQADQAAIRPAAGSNLELTATLPIQLPHLQQNLLNWAKGQIARSRTSYEEACMSYENAIAGGFTLKPFEEIISRERKRVEYYEKIVVALDNGYVLMPHLDGDVFAIRINKKQPRYQLVRFQRSNIRDERSQALPVGAGHYVGPTPLSVETEAEHTVKDYQTKQNVTSKVKAFETAEFDDVDFPMDVAKPEIIEAVSRAMALRAFDEMALAPPRWRKDGDPVVMGLINVPDSRHRKVAFLIAWHIPTIEI